MHLCKERYKFSKILAFFEMTLYYKIGCTKNEILCKIIFCFCGIEILINKQGAYYEGKIEIKQDMQAK